MHGLQEDILINPSKAQETSQSQGARRKEPYGEETICETLFLCRTWPLNSWIFEAALPIQSLEKTGPFNIQSCMLRVAGGHSSSRRIIGSRWLWSIMSFSLVVWLLLHGWVDRWISSYRPVLVVLLTLCVPKQKHTHNKRHTNGRNPC